MERFHPLSNDTKFGKLEFLGGLHVASKDPLFGGLSGIRMIGTRMIAISDAGYWFDAQLERTDGRLTGLRDMRITPMLDEGGQPFRHKWEIDAEGLERVGNGWFVSTERDIRLLAFEGDPFAQPVKAELAFRPEQTGLRGNRGFESVAWHPSQEDILLLTEDTRDSEGHIRGFAVWWSSHIPFSKVRPVSVRKSDNFNVTDAAFLPNGDLLMLERRFDLSSGPGLRVRRVVGPAIKRGATFDGETLLEAALPHQIDNMEGIAVSPHPEGHRITLVSDDNRSLLQRTLILEFLLRK